MCIFWIEKDTYKIIEPFDLVVVSGEEGIMKPAAGIYERTIKRLGCKPEETIFIDDFLHNIEGAQAVGMVGVHYQKDTNLPAIFASHGITPDLS